MLFSGEHAFTRLWDNYCSLLLSLNINNLTRHRVGGGDNGVWQWVAWVTDQPLHVQISLNYLACWNSVHKRRSKEG